MKKSLILALGALLCAPTFAQKYTVCGVAPEGAKVVYMRNVQNSHDVRPDSIILAADRTFTFQGETEGRLFAELYTDREQVDVVPAVLDGNVTVDFEARTASGTSENALLTEARADIAHFQSEMESIEKKVGELQASGVALTEEVLAPFIKRYETANANVGKIVVSICDNNLKSVAPAYFLRTAANDIDRSDIIRWADAKAAFMQTSLLAPIASRVEAWKRAEPGQMFTDLEENDPEGKAHRLSEYVGKGNYVLIDFWASWCGPCLQEMPNVKAAYEKYHAKGFDIVGLSFDQDHKAWTAAIKRLGMPWHHLSDLKAWDTVAAKTYGINAIPATLLVGPDGKIIANGLRGDALQAKLKEIFGE